MADLKLHKRICRQKPYLESENIFVMDEDRAMSRISVHVEIVHR